MLLTLDQVQIVRYPKSQYRFSALTSAVAVILTWIFGFVALVPPLTPVGRGWNVFASNSLCLGLDLQSVEDPGWPYSLTVFVFIIGTLYLVTGFGQLSIYR
ncbi:G-protein coupled receptor GRL101 [Elysia marginata]|uniref:G-protein coupled receptor GRL101 n=1 Tax=Elysia marginata TaxID=1093978 RepID=A0AAV4HN51_9GAST|nr:G-protein coupled receptor GRL101 [Elysia marginata]